MRSSARLLRGGGFYATSAVDELFRSYFGSKCLFETVSSPDIPKVFMNSTIVEAGNPVPYLFRNYNLPPEAESRYQGGCHAKVWEALRATTAVPGYFDSITIDGRVHQDGSLLHNNPSSLGQYPSVDTRILWESARQVSFTPNLIFPPYSSYSRSEANLGL